MSGSIDRFIKVLEESAPITDSQDILYGFSLAIERLKQIKDKPEKRWEPECGDCGNYNSCKYYHNRRRTSKPGKCFVKMEEQTDGQKES